MDTEDYDVDNARVVIGLEFCDVMTALEGEITTAEATVLKDRVTALRVQLFELHNAKHFREVDLLLDEEIACTNTDERSGVWYLMKQINPGNVMSVATSCLILQLYKSGTASMPGVGNV
ncbi:hypothetical protein A1O1_05583 [Capronia coronata CBS 617.96]|uniref:Uncharacterized protein n=1 Tax=Capronia coronata CBS 617.96 TaxID=1182541 RepID=W9Y729_9EURO|nr:uncharacterized protein A1O1_05583 [Capronia coronata CBS 617.96]EXJ88652.1 hypothetical protein A1O1_05583 [Capronia coronata CBS 617.96]